MLFVRLVPGKSASCKHTVVYHTVYRPNLSPKAGMKKHETKAPTKANEPIKPMYALGKH